MKSRYNHREIKRAIIILVILAPLFTFILGKMLPQLPASSMMSDYFWANKISNEHHYDIVAVGDSRIYRGINPEILSNRLNLNVMNYGFSAAGLDSCLIYSAVDLLNSDGKKILFFGITPSTFTNEALKNEHYHSLKKINSKDLFIRKNLYPKLSFFNIYSLSDLKKVYSNENYYQTYQNNGFIYSNKTPSDSLSAFKSYTNFFKKNLIDNRNELKFFNIIKQLSAKGYTCYAFRVPVASPIALIENQIFNFSAFKNAFKNAGGHWISIPMNGFDSYDGSHLSGSSADKLSYILSDSILKYH